MEEVCTSINANVVKNAIELMIQWYKVQQQKRKGAEMSRRKGEKGGRE
jgi:hypothetical protein